MIRPGIRRLFRLALWRRDSRHRDVDDEMRLHLELRARQLREQGRTSEDSEREAIRRFGELRDARRDLHLAAGRRDHRMHRHERLTGARQDVGYALRVLRRNPGYTCAAVATFALGIGAATVIFSMVHGVLLRPLPYRNPGELVTLWERNVSKGANENVVAMTSFDAWRKRSRSFAGMAALVPAPVTIIANGSAIQAAGAQVSAGYFKLLGVTPAIGRDFSDDEAGNTGVAILSNRLWLRQLGGDPAIAGRRLTIDGKTVTVVGVMPAGFEPPRFGWLNFDQELWIPLGPAETYRPWGRAFHVVARLRSGASLQRARTEIAAIGDRLAVEVPSSSGWTATATGLAAEITGDVRQPLFLLLCGVSLLLLMAVTNVAALAIGLAKRRRAEYAVRRAIGASTGRLVRQLVVQSALLAGAGCAAGLALAATGLRGLVALLPPNIPHADAIRLDGVVLLAAAASTAIASVLFGTVTAVRSRSDGGGGLAGLLRGTRSGPVASRWSGALIATEVSLAVVITILAGLMMRSFANLRTVPLGFSAEHVVAGRIGLSGARYAAPERQRAFFDALTANLRAAPGVRSVSLASLRPFRGGSSATDVTDPVHPPARASELPATDILFVDSAYFPTMRVPLAAGPGFSATESATGVAHVVVTQSLSRALGMGLNPIGRHVTIALNGGIDAEIVGVSGDLHLASARVAPRGAAFLAAARFPSSVYDLLIRGDLPPEQLVTLMRNAVASLDATVPVYDAGALQDAIDASTSRDRFTFLILAIFSFVSLVLASVGIYGVCSSEVMGRTREIGIRRALGARTRGIVIAVLNRSLRRAIIGVAVGLVVALVLTRGMTSMLFGVSPVDPIAFGTVTVLLLGVAMLATLVPALRATWVSPLIALRNE